MSSPAEPSTSSFSPWMAEIETGTSLAFSTRRWAVTCRVSSATGSLVAGASWAAAVNGSRAARATTRGCTDGVRPWAVRFGNMAIRLCWEGWWTGATRQLLQYNNSVANTDLSLPRSAPPDVKAACRRRLTNPVPVARARRPGLLAG
ncbi:hypothetical protein D9M71_731570 [compost metagenome]